jgi:hypothetical protein
MAINSDATPADESSVDESSMFAPIPAWERSKKRRGFGRGSRSAEPRSFAPPALDETPETAAVPGAGPAIDPAIDSPAIDSEVPIADAGFAAAPAYATRAKAKPSRAPVAIAAGIVLIGGVAAAGWYYSQPHGQTGVAELTPGGAATTTTTTTGTAVPNAAPPAQVAQNTPPPAAARTSTTTRTQTIARRAQLPRRSAAASDNATDTAFIAPVPPANQVPAAPAGSAPPMPLPTPGVAPPSAAATPAAPPLLNVPPAANAPAATPQTAAPPPTQVPQA